MHENAWKCAKLYAKNHASIDRALWPQIEKESESYSLILSSLTSSTASTAIVGELFGNSPLNRAHLRSRRQNPSSNRTANTISGSPLSEGVRDTETNVRRPEQSVVKNTTAAAMIWTEICQFWLWHQTILLAHKYTSMLGNTAAHCSRSLVATKHDCSAEVSCSASLRAFGILKINIGVFILKTTQMNRSRGIIREPPQACRIWSRNWRLTASLKLSSPDCISSPFLPYHERKLW